jgi:hypothetical protein
MLRILRSRMAVRSIMGEYRLTVDVVRTLPRLGSLCADYQGQALVILSEQTSAEGSTCRHLGSTSRGVS